jgi:hypothetical protein
LLKDPFLSPEKLLTAECGRERRENLFVEMLFCASAFLLPETLFFANRFLGELGLFLRVLCA